MGPEASRVFGSNSDFLPCITVERAAGLQGCDVGITCTSPEAKKLADRIESSAGESVLSRLKATLLHTFNAVMDWVFGRSTASSSSKSTEDRGQGEQELKASYAKLEDASEFQGITAAGLKLKYAQSDSGLTRLVEGLMGIKQHTTDAGLRSRAADLCDEGFGELAGQQWLKPEAGHSFLEKGQGDFWNGLDEDGWSLAASQASEFAGEVLKLLEESRRLDAAINTAASLPLRRPDLLA